jgi:hypothetical protein
LGKATIRLTSCVCYLRRPLTRRDNGSGEAILADAVPIKLSHCRAWLLASALVLAGYQSEPARAPSIGEAYAGPATLVLRKDMSPRSPEVVTVRHGDRLEIIQRRRHSQSQKRGWP